MKKAATGADRAVDALCKLRLRSRTPFTAPMNSIGIGFSGLAGRSAASELRMPRQKTADRASARPKRRLIHRRGFQRRFSLACAAGFDPGWGKWKRPRQDLNLRHAV